jgi:hypothetical protein
MSIFFLEADQYADGKGGAKGKVVEVCKEPLPVG